MRKVAVFINGTKAAELIEHNSKSYELNYEQNYQGLPISLTLPVKRKPFTFNQFPTFFEGVLPEGMMLDSLLRTRKIDKDDYFSQLMAVGMDLVGHVTVEEIK
jgi:serine/threonine-protein kinase HipA